LIYQIIFRSGWNGEENDSCYSLKSLSDVLEKTEKITEKTLGLYYRENGQWQRWLKNSKGKFVVDTDN